VKPLGAIPPGFVADGDGRLLIGGVDVETLAARAGDTPLFVHDLSLIRARIARLRAAMPAGLGIHYAVKANPLPALAAWMRGLVDGFDVASGGELSVALAAGMLARHVSFAGPGKRAREIEAAVAAGATLNLESEGEADRAFTAGERLGLTPRLAVRVNPSFELKGSGMRMGGGAKPFGVDAARVPALVRRIAAAGADYRGLHIYAGSQALDAAAIIEAQAATVALARTIAAETEIEAPLVNLGGGFGVPYFAGDRPLDIEAVGAALADMLSRDGAGRYAIELGRWIVAEAGVYLTRIVDRKESMGRVFLVTDGGLHHQLAASGNFGTVVRRNYPVAIATRFGAEASEEASVVGCLCTPLDRLADEAMLPRADVGDLVAVFLAGAYGGSASPSAFLGHAPAPELLVGEDDGRA
jgi:diaminopimelate decarboxylase